ncbi:uncharacterized protein PGTG_22749 [Puccinia graminis f. sp. tritici CRL 75-36-700-3]|uniref:Dcp1p-Dcp2p decapping enzyme complex alpha subunit n=1 Tax=Puccinia graminis f. sp. tritici (strain CRL 75-36-700-3 / race SCCL) TaxID=418459 RepID=H6QVI3_PUCGT|nr:uncharacterized protein PGTG_22749 [Puccinia graminis f. sp. tritici CRL 75-36-700-3]EHS62998.1 hypothetical protein PGTG_22749 [Puccinia graminis f. sp. tritici CRL 75-36-700-3]
MSTTAAPEVTPKTKFLQQPSIYKHDVEQLSADGLNFDKWKRGLTRVILLTLGHANFFDKAENYAKLTAQENTCLLFLIQITIHDELASLVDQYTKGTEAYDAVQTNFQGTVRFRQMELIDKLLELRISGPTTEPSQVPGLFNKVFEIFTGLHKVGAGLPTVVESLILQAISPTPASMSRSQLFQNISLQLGSKKDVSARDIQTIITSAYGESLRFDSNQPTSVSVFRTWNQPASSPNNTWTSRNPGQQRNANVTSQSSSYSQNAPRQSNNGNHARPHQQNIGRPGLSASG